MSESFGWGRMRWSGGGGTDLYHNLGRWWPRLNPGRSDAARSALSGGCSAQRDPRTESAAQPDFDAGHPRPVTGSLEPKRDDGDRTRRRPRLEQHADATTRLQRSPRLPERVAQPTRQQVHPSRRLCTTVSAAHAADTCVDTNPDVVRGCNCEPPCHLPNDVPPQNRVYPHRRPNSRRSLRRLRALRLHHCGKHRERGQQPCTSPRIRCPRGVRTAMPLAHPSASPGGDPATRALPRSRGPPARFTQSMSV